MFDSRIRPQRDWSVPTVANANGLTLIFRSLTSPDDRHTGAHECVSAQWISRRVGVILISS